MASEPTRKNKKAARLDEILEVAARLFFQRGYAQCTLADIGAELGMNKASLYYYVESKEDLLAKVVTNVSSELRSVMDEIETITSPVERFERVVRNHVAVVLGNREVFGILIEQRRQLDEAALTPLLPGEARYVDGIRRLLKDLESQGHIVAADERLRLGLTMDMLNGVVRWHPRSASIESTADFLWASIARCLGLNARIDPA